MKLKSVTTFYAIAIHAWHGAAAFSLFPIEDVNLKSTVGSRRVFVSNVALTVVGGTAVARPGPAHAATTKEIITTTSGIKYAVTKEPASKNPAAPLQGELSWLIRSWPIYNELAPLREQRAVPANPTRLERHRKHVLV